MKILVIAPHPDDEVLGVGGTMHLMSEQGHDITVSIVTKGWEPLFSEKDVTRVRREALEAGKVLGAPRVGFMDMPVTRLHAMPKHEINAAFDALIQEERPEMVFLPFPGDRHVDHKEVFDAAMVALRPVQDRLYVQKILCYETVSETHWSAPQIEPCFNPQVWVDISEHLEAKLDAMRKYASQLRPAPDSRSIEALSALARWRGSVAGMQAAETFIIVRQRGL